MVRLRPNSSDDGRLLACRAENRNLPTAVIEDTWKLSVYCKYFLRLVKVPQSLKYTFGTLNQKDSVRKESFLEVVSLLLPEALEINLAILI